jgi:hypothetical protein
MPAKNWLMGSLLGVLAASVGCGAAGPADNEGTAAAQSELSGSIVISGRVTTASGVGIPWVTVTLAGASTGLQVTDAKGNYSFSGLAAGSYALTPAKYGCGFTPSVVNLNGIKTSVTKNFSASGASCTAAPKAMMLVDQRLYQQLSYEISQYRSLAEQRRGFSIDLRIVGGVDDMKPPAVKSLIIGARTTNPSLEGVLLIGNIKLPSFYKVRADNGQDHIFPVYYEDLDATFSKNYADGAIDPDCSTTTSPMCIIGGPFTVPAHDFDAVAKGPQPDPEIWTSHMPVGVLGGANTYADFANQLRPYLQKVIRYYSGQITSNGRFYLVGNDRNQLNGSWDAFGGAKVDFYGKPGPNGETDDACVASGQNLCYQRWATENFTTYDGFAAYFDTFPWVGEGWQTGSVLISHMNAALYDVAEINVHSGETFSLISSADAKALTKAGLIVALDGCAVGGFSQPGSTSITDDTWVMPDTNILLSYLYGNSQAIAGTGDPFNRGHLGNVGVMTQALKIGKTYLGQAHLLRMKQNYASAGSDPANLPEQAAELLVGDPFMNL